MYYDPKQTPEKPRSIKVTDLKPGDRFRLPGTPRGDSPVLIESAPTERGSITLKYESVSLVGTTKGIQPRSSAPQQEVVSATTRVRLLPPVCGCTTDVGGNTSIQRIKSYHSRSCSKNGGYVLVNRKGGERRFCGTHVRLALEGLVDAGGNVEGTNNRADIRRYGLPKPYEGEWTEPEGN